MLILAKLQAKACNFTKNNTPIWVFFTFLNFMDDTKSRKASHLNSSQISKHSIIYLKNKDYTFPLNFVLFIRPDVLQDYVFPLNFVYFFIGPDVLHSTDDEAVNAARGNVNLF